MTSWVRPDHRRGIARDDPAGGDGDDLLGLEPSWIVGLLLIAFVIIAPNGRYRRASSGRTAARGRRANAGRGGSTRSPPPGSASISAGLSRSSNIDFAVMPGERLWADRPQRFGQEHVGQLPLRGTLRHDSGTIEIRRASARPRSRLPSAIPGSGFPAPQLSIAEAVSHDVPRRQFAHTAALRGQRPARRTSLRSRDRGTRFAAPRRCRARRQGPPAAARPNPGRDAQARTRPRRRQRAAAVVRR